MPSERENTSSQLNSVEYDIAGNVLRAYYNDAGKLIFVVDETVNDTKPNVMLIINPADGRKWDDVLANDYGVDLETVRPKKDNKYQKLDIEYSGLDVYDNLINVYDASGDLTGALEWLADFRDMAARRAATERLNAAESAAANARDTIAKTNQTISELQGKVKELRSKLNAQKKEIGREPTKQSASKILRTEAQIDATNEKQARAKKRLLSAQKRLLAAEEDAETARAILARVHTPDDGGTLPAAPLFTGIAVAPQFTEITENTTNQNNEPKAEDMADEEVKPLFDKDPEILDQEIAFKPIDFGTPALVDPVAEREGAPIVAETAEIIAPAPLSFVPPVSDYDDADKADADVVAPVAVAPVLDTITSVATPDGDDVVVDQELMVSPTSYDATVPVAQPEPQPVAEPVMPQAPQPIPTPMPDVVPASNASGMRPVSPITGKSVSGQAVDKKPTLVYYVLLLVLIVLSIFTLWIYQKSASDNIPELAATTQPEQTAPAPVAESQTDSPFISMDDNTPQPVSVTPVAEPAPAPIVTAEVVSVETSVVEPEPEPVPVVVEPEPVPVVVMPDLEPVVVPEPVPVIEPEPIVEPEAVIVDDIVIPTEEEIIASKPGYNVSQQENMFVAADDYDTEVVYEQEVGSAEMCADGSAPDVNGCCTGETYTDMGDGFACCAGDECFPPML